MFPCTALVCPPDARSRSAGPGRTSLTYAGAPAPYAINILLTEKPDRSYPAFLWTALELLVAHLCVSAPAVSVLCKTMQRSLTSAVRSVSSSVRDKDQSDGPSHGSSAREQRSAPRPRPLTPRGEDGDGYGDEVELRPTARSSRFEAQALGTE